MCPDCGAENEGNFVCHQCRLVRPLDVGFRSGSRFNLSDEQLAELKASRAPKPKRRRGGRGVFGLVLTVVAALLALIVLVSAYVHQTAKDLASNSSLQAGDLGAGWESVRSSGVLSGPFLGPATTKCLVSDPNHSGVTGTTVAYRETDVDATAPRFAGSRTRVYKTAKAAVTSAGWYAGTSFRECVVAAFGSDARAGLAGGVSVPQPAVTLTTIAGQNGAPNIDRFQLSGRSPGGVQTVNLDLAVLHGGRVINLVYFVSVRSAPDTEVEQSALDLVGGRLPSAPNGG